MVARQATTIGNLRCLAACHFVLGYRGLLQGAPRDAATSLQQSLALHERLGSSTGVACTRAVQLELLTAAGVHAPELLELGLVAAEQAAIREHCLAQLHTAGIRNHLRASDEAAATAIAEVAIAHDAATPPCGVCQIDADEALASLFLALGEPRRAMPFLEQAMQLADFVHSEPGRARLLRRRGQLHVAQGESAEAERCLTEAARIFRAVGDRYDLAPTLRASSELVAAPDRAALRAEAETILSTYRCPELSTLVRA